MITSKQAGASGPEMQEFKLDRSLLGEILRRKRRLFIAVGAGVLTVCMLFGLLVFPQTFTTTASVAMQSSTAMPSSLGALLGGSPGGKKYTGVLKSRNFAEKVERAANIQKLYNLPTHEDAVNKIMKCAKFEDNPTEGLLYITVALDAPAKLAHDPTGQRDKVRQAAAIVGNTYISALRDWLKNSDVERESVLLRTAETELAKAENDYNSSVTNLLDFIRNSKASPEVIASAGGSMSQGGGSSPAASAVGSLFVRRGELEQQIRSADALIADTNKLLNNPDLEHLPSEDPLLTEARKQFNEAATKLQNLEATYGPANPSVRRAQASMKTAAQQLHEQVQAILKGSTTQQFKRDALQAEYETTLKQIEIAGKHFQTGRELTAELQKREWDATLNLEVLKTAASHYAEMKMESVSGENRMTVIDEARAEPRSKPGFLMITGVSIAFTVLTLILWLAIEYMVRSLRGSTPPEAVVQSQA